MTIEKRGSEKLLNEESGLCSLTAEELSQVGGMGPVPVRIWKFPDIVPVRKFEGIFPNGKFPPDLFRDLLNRAGLGTETGNPP